MTARELANQLLSLNEEDLDREVIMFDGPMGYTPYQIKVLTKKFWGKHVGKILID